MVNTCYSSASGAQNPPMDPNSYQGSDNGENLTKKLKQELEKLGIYLHSDFSKLFDEQIDPKLALETRALGPQTRSKQL